MSQGDLQRAALGQSASLGMLYDARTDSFLSGFSLLTKAPPVEAVIVTDSHTSEIQLSFSDTYDEKLRKMDLTAELGASFLCGMINVGGSGRYLQDTRDSDQTLQASLHYKITTVHEKLNLTHDGLKECLALNILQSGDATHVVVGICWGAQSVVTAKHRLSNRDEKDKVDGCLKAEFLKIKSIIKIEGDANVEVKTDEQRRDLSFEVTVYGDVLADDELLPTDFPGAYKFMSNVPRYIRGANGGKGKQLMYILAPVASLARQLDLEMNADLTIAHLNTDCLQKFVYLFDSLRNATLKLNDYNTEVSKYTFCLPPDHIRLVAQYLQDTKLAEAQLKENYAQVLKDVRCGKSDAQELFHLLADAHENLPSLSDVDVLMGQYREKISFVEMVITKGVKYVGHNGITLDNELMDGRYEDVYVLYFSENARRERTTWEGNQYLLLQLLENAKTKYKVVVVDCELIGISLDKSHLSLYRNARLVVRDLLDEQRPDQCLARYNKDDLENTTKFMRPLERRPVVVPCPGHHCVGGQELEWVCFKCFTPIEYGHSDEYLYCDCGRALYSSYSFKCKEARHGSAFEKYNPEVLLRLLNALKGFQQLNVLILGETGVGKSTFINAFINYITFESLDDAINCEKLNWVIPCSFAMQEIVYDAAHRRGQYVQKTVKVGHDEDERDSNMGQSSTQKTTVYSMASGKTIIRLIDTPGIGDTGGVKKDEENMAGILATLKYFEELHGILILLKSNDSRLTVMLRFCVKELLTHLHRDAAQNMVFGFTNARISNYMPGDTFIPLGTLLQEHSDVGIGLWPYTTYFFDSESFRFLAAHKQGVHMPNKPDFERSWLKSRDETERLLTHFRNLDAHNVRSTRSLNKVRESIAALTVPMAMIEQKIKATIRRNEDLIEELRYTQAKGDALREKLYFRKLGTGIRLLAKPRTVCTDTSCVEYRDKQGEPDQKTTIYKTHCHATCWLENVPPDVLCPPQLLGCDAFGGSEHCRRCGHHRGVHQHVLYDQYDTWTLVKDAEYERMLNENNNEVELKERGIAKINEEITASQGELEFIQVAAARFGLFLKTKSILPYNDAMVEYLDHLIRQEAEKVALNEGVSPKHLEELQASRAQYLLRIATLDRHMGAGDDGRLMTEDDVDRLMTQLYSLKHWGQNLETLMKGTEAASRATYRERPYRIPPSSSSRKGVYRTKGNKKAGVVQWLGWFW